MRSLLLIAALASVACSTTLREREVIYVPVGHNPACPCPPGAARSAHASSAVPARGVRDAVPRTYYGKAQPSPRDPYAKKPGRIRPKRERAADAETPAAKHADLPPGLAKKNKQRGDHGNEQASWAKKKKRKKHQRQPDRTPEVSETAPATGAS